MGVLEGVTEGGQPGQAIGRRGGQHDEQHDTDGAHDQDVSFVHAAHVEKDRADARHDHGHGHVGLQHDEAGDDADDQQHGRKTQREGPHVVLMAGHVGAHEEDHAELGDL